jgi:hypothetical protein
VEVVVVEVEVVVVEVEVEVVVAVEVVDSVDTGVVEVSAVADKIVLFIEPWGIVAGPLASVVAALWFEENSANPCVASVDSGLDSDSVITATSVIATPSLCIIVWVCTTSEFALLFVVKCAASAEYSMHICSTGFIKCCYETIFSLI